MPIILARSAGFCFGVNRAVDMTRELLEQGASVSLLGELIHNKQVTQELQDLGAAVVESPQECRPGDTLVIRAHGVPKETMEAVERAGIGCCDATCPFVRRIHEIISEHSSPDVPAIIIGDPKHPEVTGIQSYAAGGAFVVRDAGELEELLAKHPEWDESPPVVVAQTTFLAQEFKKSLEILKKHCTNTKIFDTICYATQSRQEEARLLAASCDAMVVIGDGLSSNTRKLLSVCGELCPSWLVEGCEELRQYQEELSRCLSGTSRTIGCTAGASTPARTIKEVLKTMSELTQEPIVQEEIEAAEPEALAEPEVIAE